MALTWVGSPTACGDDADDADSLQTKACPRLVEAGWRRLNLLTNECFCEGFGAMTNCGFLSLKVSQKAFLQHLSRNIRMLTGFEKRHWCITDDTPGRSDHSSCAARCRRRCSARGSRPSSADGSGSSAGLRFQTEDRQKAEIAIAVQILNYRLGLGGPDSVRTAASERREGLFVSNITSRQQGSFGSPEPTSARFWHGPRRRHRAQRPAGKERVRLGCGERAATAAAAPPHRRHHPALAGASPGLPIAAPSARHGSPSPIRPGIGGRCPHR